MKIGDKVPALSVEDFGGAKIDLQQLKGPAVIYFYPKDETSGCTIEACEFRDRYDEFLDLGAQVVGISHDSPESHQRFAARHNLKFTLLSDPDDRAKTAFGIKDSLFGMLKGRETFVFDSEMKLIYRFRSSVRFKDHISNALRALKER